MKHKKFALALGGGSARGLAHIGVLKYLEEKNYIPSHISGTSMGSIIGGLFALGYTADSIKEICEDKGILDIMSFNPMTGEFLALKKFKKVFGSYFADKTFADTKIPFSVIATSLSTGEKKVFTKGSILDAICASIAIPGVFSPYKIGSEYFIDGGMRENLPLSTCGKLPIVASSVVMPAGNSQFKKVSHFWRPLASAYEAITIMLDEQEKLNISLHKDICVIHLDDKSVNYMDFKKGKNLVSIGYKNTKKSNIDEFLQKNFSKKLQKIFKI